MFMGTFGKGHLTHEEGWIQDFSNVTVGRKPQCVPPKHKTWCQIEERGCVAAHMDPQLQGHA